MVEYHKWRWRFLYFWIISFTILTFYSIREIRNISNRGVEAHQGLCAFKLDLVGRVDSSEQFLKDHPHGIPGIPNSVIRTSIKNQRLTLKSLEHFKCT